MNKPFTHPDSIPAHSPALAAGITSDRSGIWALLVMAVTLAVQFMLLAHTFPLAALGSDLAMFHVDSAYHWYRMTLSVNLAETARGIGFDPYFGAGYLSGATIDWSANFPATLAVLLRPWWGAMTIYKFYAFSCALLAPVCVGVAARLMRLSPPIVAGASVFGLLLWWASVFHWYHTVGMVSFVAASYLSLPFLALLLRLVERPDWRLVIGLGLLGAFGMFYHPLFPVPIALWTIVFLILNWKTLDRGLLIKMLLVVPALALIPNLPWLSTIYHTVGLDNGGPYQKVVDINLVWQELVGIWSGEARGSKINIALVLTALWGWRLAASAREIMICRVMVISGFLLIVFAAVGAAIPGGGVVEPNRFSPVAYLLLCIPAAMGVRAMFTLARGQHGKLVWLARISLLVALGVIAYSANELRREVSYADVGHYGKRPPEVAGIGPYSTWIVDFLQNQTNASGRVLFELSSGRLYDDAHMAGYYAYSTGRELIGGPYPYFNASNSYWDGQVFGKPIAEIGTQDFDERLQLYNIGWIMAHSETSKRYLDQLPFLEPLGGYREFKAYKVKRQLNYFVKGSGVVKARAHNRLSLSELAGKEVILKYHYVPGLKSVPEAELVPVMLSNDPTPFIKIVNPPGELRLFIP